MPQTRLDETYTNGVVTGTSRTVSDRQIYLESLEATLQGGVLANLTPDQADAWIDANVTSIATARTALKVLARLILVLRDSRP